MSFSGAGSIAVITTPIYDIIQVYLAPSVLIDLFSVFLTVSFSDYSNTTPNGIAIAAATNGSVSKGYYAFVYVGP